MNLRRSLKTSLKETMKTYYELGYMDIDEAREKAGEMNRHHFHYYDSGMVTYKKEYIHLYKRKICQ